MLVNEFSPLPIGGAEMQAERLSGYLAKQGCPVWVVTRRAKGLDAVEERNGFTILRPQTTGIGKIRTITFVLSTLVILFKMRKKYEILHAHLAFGPAFAGALIGRLLGKKVIVKLGGSGVIGDVNVSKATLRGRVRLAAIRNWADVVIVLSDVMREEALGAGIPAEKTRVVNNGIDTNFFITEQPKGDLKAKFGLQGKVVVLFVGRVEPVKSLPTVIEAVSDALSHIPNLHLVVVGDGSERKALEHQAEELGVAEHVTFAGKQKDVRAYLQAADIFVLPSLTEGISNALLEAMASGLACVASSVGGNIDVLGHGKFGLLLPVGDVPRWAEALTVLASDAKKREKLGLMARKQIFATYDFSVVGAAYEAMYAELVNNVKKDVRTLTG